MPGPGAPNSLSRKLLCINEGNRVGRLDSIVLQGCYATDSCVWSAPATIMTPSKPLGNAKHLDGLALSTVVPQVGDVETQYK